MKLALVTCFFLIVMQNTFGQGVGVATTTPHASAALDVSGTDKGVLIPRMTTTQRNAIVSPAPGLIIFNLDDQCIDMYDSANWIKNCGMKITGTDTVPSAWTQKANFGGTARWQAVGFSIGTKGYIGTGADGALKKDFWEYTPETNAWTQKADFGGTARAGAVGFSIGNFGYIGTGFDGVYRADFWVYDPSLNTWVQKASYGGSGRVEAFSFTTSGTAIVGCGSSNNFATWFNDVWEYFPGPNTWLPKNNFPALAHSMTGLGLNNMGYVGLGWRKGLPPFFPDSLSSTFYKFDPSSGSWTQVASMPGAARHNAEGFSINETGYVGTGFSLGPVYHQDFWTYDPVSNSWTQTVNFSGAGRAHATGFSIGTKGYLGTGTGPAATFQDFWEFDPYPLGPIYESSLPLTSAYSVNDGVWTKENNIVSTTNKVDIISEPRTGMHPSNAALYVTGDLQPSSGGMEIRQSNGDQGLGLGYNTIYGAGNNANQDISLTAKGPAGHLLFSTNGTQRMKIGGDGKIGIGTLSPNAPLQFSNSLVNRKIVLFEAGNNDHQYMGLGTNGATLRYQVSSTGDSHIFYAGTSSSASTELMRIQGNGNAGIGISNATNKLDIQSGPARTGTHATDRAFYVTGALQESSSGIEFRHDNGTQGIGFGFNTIYAAGSNANQDLGLASKGTGILKFNTNGLERLRITGTGNIGIGTITPNAPLQLANALANRKVVLWESQNNDHQFLGFGINGSALRYQVSNNADAHVFYAGTSSSTSQELMRIKGNGNVTISGLIENEGYIAPSLLNGFTNHNNGYVNAGYYKDKEGIVRLRGTVYLNANPNGLGVFVLPVGYQPTSGTVAFPVGNSGSIGLVEVLWDGSVFVQNCVAGWISLDSITFRAD